MKKPRKKGLDGRTFDALSAEEKERIYQEIDRMTPGEMEARSKPLTAAQRAKWVRATKKKMGLLVFTFHVFMFRAYNMCGSSG